ncbi:recombinase family protein [Paracoccus marcusii]|uniref:recombinase family protein n=1 Tax=Paracoccus marcusii TaxID=59779 RepID=UPI0037355C38
MIVGYARTSTFDQVAGIEAQERDLLTAGCEKVFREQVSSVDVAQRDQLSAALEFLREGDTLVVSKLDRLARSVAHMHDVIKRIADKGAALKILNLGIDTNTPTGKLMLNILGGVAQFEREIMLERQREGIQKAKLAGKYKGRSPTARDKAVEIKALISNGIGATEISRRLGISRASVYNVLKKSAAG